MFYLNNFIDDILVGNSLDINSVIKLISNKGKLYSKIKRFNNLKNDNKLLQLTCQVVAAYINENKVLTKAFISEKLSDNDMANEVIAFVLKYDLLISRDDVFQAFAEHDKLTDNVIKEHLLSIEFAAHINMLGFGMGSGEYEKSLVAFLKAKNRISNAHLFGYDPNGEFSQDKDITLITEPNSKKLPQFDLVIIRWVLHHVETKDRWSALKIFLSKLKKSALVLAVEHGYTTNNNPSSQAYKLINIVVDVLANLGIRPHWLVNGSHKITENFFLDYLQPYDFHDLNTGWKKIGATYENELQEIAPYFPIQTLWTLKSIS